MFHRIRGGWIGYETGLLVTVFAEAVEQAGEAALESPDGDLLGDESG